MEVTEYGLREVMRRMWPLAADHRRRLLWAMLLVFVATSAMAVMPLIGKVFFDSVIPARRIDWALCAGGVFLALGVVRTGTYYFGMLILYYVGEAVVFRMRQRGFSHLQGLCLRFHSRYPSGFIYTRMFEQAIVNLGVFFRTAFSSILVQTVGLVFSMAVCVWLSPPMAGVVLVGSVAYVYIARRMGPKIRELTREAYDAHNWIAGFILDRLRGTKTIQAFTMERQVQSEFNRKVWPMQLKWIETQKETMRLTLFTEGVSYLIHSAIWVIGAWAIWGWNMTLGDLVAFMAYQGQLTARIANLAGLYGQFASARSGFDLYHTVMDTTSTVVDHAPNRLPEPIRGELAFENVTFAYDNDPALVQVSFTVPPGQTVALVGRSGSGKTTISNLLLRFYDPDRGRVLLDGADIRELGLRKYRALFGVVLQEPYLFDDTIEANIRCADPRASEDDIRDALEKAQAMEFIERLPHGLRERIGEGGSHLSGGQRQRLAIARCMLLKSRFLILDEATSALDNETELFIQQALNNLFEGKTAFVIAHRLSTIRRANRILVMDKGRIVEDGTFDELLAADGMFRYLHNIATSTSTRQFKLDETGFA